MRSSKRLPLSLGKNSVPVKAYAHFSRVFYVSVSALIIILRVSSVLTGCIRSGIVPQNKMQVNRSSVNKREIYILAYRNMTVKRRSVDCQTSQFLCPTVCCSTNSSWSTKVGKVGCSRSVDLKISSKTDFKVK